MLLCPRLMHLFPDVAQVAQSFGLLLGTILMNPKTAQTIAAILMLAFVLTGGYFVRGTHLHAHACLLSDIQAVHQHGAFIAA